MEANSYFSTTLMFCNNIAIKNILHCIFRGTHFLLLPGAPRWLSRHWWEARACEASCQEPVSPSLPNSALTDADRFEIHHGGDIYTKEIGTLQIGIAFFLKTWMLNVYQHTMGENSVCKGKSGHYY